MVIVNISRFTVADGGEMTAVCRYLPLESRESTVQLEYVF